MVQPMTDSLEGRIAVRDVTGSQPVEAVAADLPAVEREEITLHFSLALTNGEVIDSNFDQPAVTFVTGDGNLLPGFEAVVKALPTGEHRTVTLPAEQAFGIPSEENIRQYPLYQFPADMPLEPGLMVAFNDGSGNDQAGVVRKLDRQTVTIDFNHPLAGRDIVFSVQIIDRRTLRD